MNAIWTRRDVLKTIAATVATPVLAHAACWHRCRAGVRARRRSHAGKPTGEGCPDVG